MVYILTHRGYLKIEKIDYLACSTFSLATSGQLSDTVWQSGF